MINKINTLIIETTKKRETRHLEVYKLVKSEFQKASKSGKSWDPIDVLLGMITTRKDSREQYLKAGRMDLADQESFEIQVIQDLLPPLPTEDEIKEGIIKEIERLSHQVSIKDTKTILTTLKPKYHGITGKLVSEIIKTYVNRT